MGPIADLSYRNYDGPQALSPLRWWPIAKNGIRISLRKKGFWVLTMFAAFPYFTLIVMLFVESQATSLGGPRNPLRIGFPELFSNSYGNWYWIFFIALLVGAGSIAADNRSNALQVYLSKPITKLDYLFGKWMSVFILVFAITFLPMLMATLYAALSKGFGDFIREYPLLFPKLLLLAGIPAGVHASLLIGISAWNKTPWVAGVIYTGIYIFWNNTAYILGNVMVERLTETGAETVKALSIQGAVSGLGFNLIGVGTRGLESLSAPRPLPEWEPLALLLLAFCAIGLLMAHARIRAVEVVQG